MPQDTDWVEDDPADVPRPRDPALDKAKTALKGATGIGPRKASLMDIVPEFLGGVRESTIDPLADTIIHPINAAKTLLTGKGAEGSAKILQRDVDTMLGRDSSDEPTFQNVPIVGPMVAGTYAGVRQPLSDAYDDVTEGRYGSAARNVGKMSGVVAGLIAPGKFGKKAAPTAGALSEDLAGSILKRTERSGAAVEQPINGPRQGPPAPAPLSPVDYVRQTIREMMPKMTTRGPEQAPKYQTKHSRTAPTGIKLDPEQIDPELVPEDAAPAAQPASPVTSGETPAPAAAPVAAAPAPVAPEAPASGHVNPNLTIPDNPGVRVLKPPAGFPEDLMTRGERTGSKPMRMAEGVVEGSVAGAGQFEKLRLDQQRELTSGYADRILDYMSGMRGTAEEVGASTQEALSAAKKRIKDSVYTEVNAEGNGAKANGKDLRDSFKAMKEDLTKGNLKVPLGKDSTILKMLDTGIKSKGFLGFQQLRTFRTQLRSLLPAAKQEIGTTAETHVHQMIDIVDRSIEQAAKTKPGLFEKWQKAQGQWADLKETFNKSTAAKLLKTKDTGKVHLALKTAPLEDLRKVRELVGDDQFNSLKARLVEDMMTKATEGELRPSGPIPGMGQSTTTAPRFTGSGLRKQLESMGSERLQTLFDKTDLDNLYKLSDVAERVGGKSGNRLGGLALNLPLMWGGGKAVAQTMTGDLGGALSSALKTGGMALATNLTARVMTRKGGPTMFRKLAEAVETGNKKLPPSMRLRMPPAKNRAEAAFWGARVGKMMAEENAKKNAPSPEDWEED